MCRPPPHYTAVWARAGAAMRGAMELGGENHENRGFFLLLERRAKGRRARLCEARGYARVVVSLDACCLHRMASRRQPPNKLTTSARA